MNGGTRLDRGTLVGAALAVVLLAAASMVAMAAAVGTGHSGQGHYRAAACGAPTLPGTRVDVTEWDMRGPMMGGGYRMPHGMRIAVSPTSVPRGVVSLVVRNTGRLTHELVVLPLAAGAEVGQRPVGAAGTVDEAGSLGEASAPCAAGTGDGIPAGATGWVTLTLPAGRYELVCNLPGHYAAGTYAELVVT